MIPVKSLRIFLFLLLCALGVTSARVTVAQNSSQPARSSLESVAGDDTNLDTHLYLVLATNRDVEEVKAPPALEQVMKQLRESLNFKHFNLTASFLNRVKNNGHLDVSWVGGPFLTTMSSNSGNPSFNQFTALVKLATGEEGRSIVRMTDFRFGSRVPIVTGQTSMAMASTGLTAFPTVSYEQIGLRTDISMREGEPVIAGTLNVGPSGDAIIVIIAARRSPN
jgi:hypothetical protein